MTKFVNFNQAPSASSMNFFGGASIFNNKTMLYFLFGVLFIILSIYLYYAYIGPTLNPKFVANNEPSSLGGASSQAELMLFYVDWCPHCKTAKPVWEEMKQEYERKNVNGYQVLFTEINCTNETPEVEKLMNKYKIEGFPTIKLLKDGQIIEFDAKPTKANLTQFLNTVL